MAPFLASLLFGTLVDRVAPAFAETSKAVIIAALTDPLSLFAARSPGERGAGALFSTKGPHERVLSAVREREAPAAAAPAAAIPAADSVGPLGDPLGDGVLSPDRAFGALPWPGFFPYPGFDWPGMIPGTDTPPVPPGTNPEPPDTSPVPESSTWLMLLAGLFAIGLKTRRPAKAAGPECPHI
ncbi:MAG TPA: PEP-CTERM sorting domain-containing protein [Rhizomicrobium sp.]|nr:PEP-CTERM sorting domain-containing protein [Rhizomicrobium sp.]